MDFNTLFSLVITTGLGALSFFIKTNFAEIKAGIKGNTDAVSELRKETDEKLLLAKRDLENQIEKERVRISALKEDLPFVYTTREDFIRFANGVDTKLSSVDSKIDKILDTMPKKGTENG